MGLLLGGRFAAGIGSLLLKIIAIDALEHVGVLDRDADVVIVTTLWIPIA